jgi:hypothetical protein
MSASTSKKIGGEYGEIRASFDTNNLDKYLKTSVKDIRTPVDVKQFKVETYILCAYHNC